MLVLCGIVVFGVVGFTALDRYDEQTCRQIPTPKLIVRRNPVYDSGDWATGHRRSFAEFPRSATASCRGESA